VLRYIYQNPKKVDLSNDIASYKWSSYHEYLSQSRIVNTEYALHLFHSEKSQAIERFKQFNHESNNDRCLELPKEGKTLSDKAIRKLVYQKFHTEIAILQNNDTAKLDKVLKYLKGIEGCSLKQISRLTGISVYNILKA